MFIYWRKIIYLVVINCSLMEITRAGGVLEVGAFPCALQPDNTVICWGSGNPPEGIFSRLGDTMDKMCGIRLDGTLVCWKREKDIQPTPIDKFLQVSVEGSHSCGIRKDRTIICWGNNDYGQIIAPEGTFSQVSVAMGFSCAIKTVDHTLTCWGHDTDYPEFPISVPKDAFSQMSGASNKAICGVRLADAKAMCWGGPNDEGEKKRWIGFWTLDDRINEGGEEVVGDASSSPPAGTFSQMAGGGQWYNCGLKTDHSVSCWGAAEPGFAEPMRPPHSQCDYLRYRGRLCESPPDLFSQVSAGSGLTCAVQIKDNSVLCWGADEDGSRTIPPGLRVKSFDPHQCLLYGVHNDGEQTQFFIINSGISQVYPRGDSEPLNLTALDIHPKTHRLYAASGKNSNKDKLSGSLYEVLNGAQEIKNLGQSGFQEISALTFHPDGNSLWGWSPEVGLFKMDNEEESGPDLKTIEVILGYDEKKIGIKIKLEDLSWNQEGNLLYGVGRILDDHDQGVNTLWVYNPKENQVDTLCDTVVTPLEKITALETLPTGQLMLGFPDEKNLNLWVIDAQSCEVISQEAIPTEYREVKGLAQPDCARPELRLQSLF